MTRLAHPTGESGIVAACADFGAVQIISKHSSMAPEEVVQNAAPDQVFGFQLYVQVDRAVSERMLARINKIAAIKFVVLTVDAAVPGKREDDERCKDTRAASGRIVEEEGGPGRQMPEYITAARGGGGVGARMFGGTDPSLTWSETIPWLVTQTDLPIVLKGIQTHEDAYLASLFAPMVKGIIVSNHGGRALDTAPPTVQTLLEIRRFCPEVFGKVEVWVDGGVRRGTDVVKAMCLGARAVGVGRAMLWGLGAGGVDGARRTLEILSQEMKTCMRLLGVESVGMLGPQHVNTGRIGQWISDGPQEYKGKL